MQYFLLDASPSHGDATNMLARTLAKDLSRARQASPEAQRKRTRADSWAVLNAPIRGPSYLITAAIMNMRTSSTLARSPDLLPALAMRRRDGHERLPHGRISHMGEGYVRSRANAVWLDGLNFASANALCAWSCDAAGSVSLQASGRHAMRIAMQRAAYSTKKHRSAMLLHKVFNCIFVERRMCAMVVSSGALPTPVQPPTCTRPLACGPSP